MTFFNFGPKDIIKTSIVANPKANVTLAGYNVTGSVFLEHTSPNAALAHRQMQGFSEVLGGLTTKFAGLSASIDVRPAVYQGTNASLYGAIQNLYQFYSLYDGTRYQLTTASASLSVINIPQVFYDRCIQTGSFTGSDYDANGYLRQIYDDCHGGLYSGSNSGSLVGNIFYSEGLVVLTTASLANFGQAVTGSGMKWSFQFAGSHTIPVNMYRCRAPGGTLNASTNKTFYTVPLTGALKNTRQVLTSSLCPYITAVGLYNENYELVAVARLAQPVRKEPGWDVGINLKIDW